MLKKLVIATALSGLMASTALAQSPSPAPSGSTATSPSMNSSSSTSGSTMGSGSAVGNTAASADTAKFVTAQTSDQWLSSKFIGTDVVGTDNTKIGDVSDVLFDQNGKVLAYVIGVGGFLGIGSKDVALAPSSFKALPPSDGSSNSNNADWKLQLAMTKDELKNAAEFKPYQAPSTVGSGSTATRPATGMAPSTPPSPAPATPSR